MKNLKQDHWESWFILSCISLLIVLFVASPTNIWYWWLPTLIIFINFYICIRVGIEIDKDDDTE